jgi:large conductance mechanosensitive channel
MIREFAKFIMRGNMMDLAVGIIIGAAFTGVVNSLVNDIIMPIVGLAVGGVDFSDIVITLREAVGDTPAVTINIGVFINTIINLLIVGFAVFLMIKAFNTAQERLARRMATAPAEAAPVIPDPALIQQQKLVEAIDSLNKTISAKM